VPPTTRRSRGAGEFTSASCRVHGAIERDVRIPRSPSGIVQRQRPAKGEANWWCERGPANVRYRRNFATRGVTCRPGWLRRRPSSAKPARVAHDARKVVAPSNSRQGRPRHRASEADVAAARARDEAAFSVTVPAKEMSSCGRKRRADATGRCAVALRPVVVTLPAGWSNRGVRRQRGQRGRATDNAAKGVAPVESRSAPGRRRRAVKPTCRFPTAVSFRSASPCRRTLIAELVVEASRRTHVTCRRTLRAGCGDVAARLVNRRRSSQQGARWPADGAAKAGRTRGVHREAKPPLTGRRTTPRRSGWSSVVVTPRVTRRCSSARRRGDVARIERRAAGAVGVSDASAVVPPTTPTERVMPGCSCSAETAVDRATERHRAGTSGRSVVARRG